MAAEDRRPIVIAARERCWGGRAVQAKCSQTKQDSGGTGKIAGPPPSPVDDNALLVATALPLARRIKVEIKWASRYS